MNSGKGPALSISDRQRKYEIAAVLLTGAGKFLFMDFLQWKLLFIIVSIFGWGAYVIYRSRKVKGILHYWGFRGDNYDIVLQKLLPFVALSVATFFIVGYVRGTLNLNWHLIPILLLYPIWGVIQQFLVIALVAGNLQDMKGNKFHPLAIIVSTAMLFGVIHYPYPWLILGTFILALVYGYVYLKARNVYVMGMFHGWLGGLFFYTVVGRDPFAEVFGKLFP